MIIFSFIFVTNFVLAFDVGDIFGGSKKPKFSFASIDLVQLRKGLDDFRIFDRRSQELDEEYSQFTQQVLAEQKKSTDDLMTQYQAEALGLNDKQRAEKLNQYKDQAQVLARDSQRRLDEKKKEIDDKKQANEQSARIMARRMVRDVAKKKGIAVVIEKKMSIYIKTDITQDVIDQVNKAKRPKLLGVL